MKFNQFPLIKYYIFVFSFVMLFLPDITNKMLADIHFYFLTCLIIVEILEVRAISLYIVWIAGFIYIILSEMILSPGNLNYNSTVRFLLAANDVVLLGYSIERNKKMFNYKKTTFSAKKTFFAVIIFLMAFYLYNTFPKVVMSYLYGRQLVSTMGSGTILGTLNQSLSLMLPSLIAFYIVHVQKKSKWWALLLSAPIFIFLIILSTRFKLLFSIIPFFLVSGFLNFNKVNIKSSIMLLIVAVLLSIFSDTTKNFRNDSYMERWNNMSIKTRSHASLTNMIADNCSPEGCVEMTYLAEKYFETHDHTYGKSIGFITYFWIPRKIWPNKPTQVDYWLPRYFNPKMPDTASTASGFTGELRADFGYFSFFFLFLLGRLLKRCNYYLVHYNYGRTPCIESIYASLLIPTTFFAIRGLNLAITTFICSYLLLKLITVFYLRVSSKARDDKQA